jgi:peroxiredoxin
VRLGYKNVYRMPTGFFGWKKDILKHDDLVNNDQMLGKYFPECQFVSINRTQDYLYLGIDQSARKIRLTDIRSQFIYVSLFNEMCSQCVEEIKQYGLLYKFFQHDAKFKNTVKIIGIGAGSSHRGVKKFIKHHNIPYPVFVDKNWDIFKCLGEPPLPVAYLLKKESGSKIKIVSIRNEHIESIADVLKEIGSIIY